MVAAAVAAALSAQGAELSLKVTVPQIAQAGPRPPTRPYVAIWLRKEDNSFATNLAVWYQIEAPARRGGPGGFGGPPGAGPGGFGGPGAAGGPPAGPGPGGVMGPPGGGMRGPPVNPRTPGGARWLNEVREWWADSGNSLQFPVDGLTSASRAAGTYELTFAGTDPKLANLPPGNYKLMVEAAREHGGKEIVSIPFAWPGTAAQSSSASGKAELGQVELTVTP
jgi:hypothetical protein